MNVVVVESPAKAKTINKYLGTDYTVLASYGHVRDLPAKDGSVSPDQDFSMVWETDARSEKRLSEIVRAVKGAERLYLATDPDREGEAISWHVREVLDKRKALKGVDVKRVVFNEITRTAVLDAIANPRELNKELIEAYLARRALDYLVGFTLSPVLWRKLPGSRSAGRVQSVALRLICEREAEIEVFRPTEYWSVDAILRVGDSTPFTGRLTHLDGEKLDKLSLGNAEAAERAAAAVRGGSFKVGSVEKKSIKRRPAPPFTTSTLQQEASRKLGLSATATMRTAQRLYEGVAIGGETVGLITYMRTDATNLAGEAIHATRAQITRDFGDSYVPSSPRMYKTKAKNAQEAHEAIRPTDVSRRPSDVARFLEPEQRRLYELIWKRTIACQMAEAVLDQVTADFSEQNGAAQLRAVGTTVAFDGFLKVYSEDRDDPADGDDEQRRLPPMAAGDPTEVREVTPEQHFTQPPPRYTEASLVKKLEELGIGRPSTYASIIQVLQDRDYVRLDRKRFLPEDRGRMVTAFLANFFRRYVEYDFTADLETQLDDISGGRADWKDVLADFWRAFSKAVEETSGLRITDVVEALDSELGPHFFPPRSDGADPRRCPACEGGRLGLKLGRTGGFIGCSNYPDCRFTRPLEVVREDDEANGQGGAINGTVLLGQDPETGLPVTLRKGPYGHYVQLGPAEGAEPASDAKDKKKKTKDKNKEKPKRTSLLRGLQPADVDLSLGLQLLALPRVVGTHPESGETITAGVGRYGPYLLHSGAYTTIKDQPEVLTIGLNRAVDLIAEAAKTRRPTVKPRSLGDHPADGKPVTLHSGRFGPYVQHNKVRATLPKSIAPEQATLDEAVALLEAKAARASGKAGGKAAAKKASPRTKSKTSAKTPAKSRKKASTSGASSSGEAEVAD